MNPDIKGDWRKSMEPPKDRNFIAKVRTFGLWRNTLERVQNGTRWVECFWYDGDFYGKPCYAEWCGNSKTLSTLGKVEIVDWIEIP